MRVSHRAEEERFVGRIFSASLWQSAPMHATGWSGRRSLVPEVQQRAVTMRLLARNSDPNVGGISRAARRQQDVLYQREEEEREGEWRSRTVGVVSTTEPWYRKCTQLAPLVDLLYAMKICEPGIATCGSSVSSRFSLPSSARQC